jgi:hypothetical protein
MIKKEVIHLNKGHNKFSYVSKLSRWLLKAYRQGLLFEVYSLSCKAILYPGTFHTITHIADNVAWNRLRHNSLGCFM